MNVVRWGSLWLESLCHYSNAFLLDELAQLLEVLGDSSLGIVPHAHSVVLKARGKPVLRGELEHLSLALSNALEGEGL